MRPQSDTGFTLVEMLIALALLSFLTILAYGAVQFTNTAWRRSEVMQESDADRVAAYRVLSRAINAAYPRFASQDTADRTVDFNGQPAVLELVAPLPDAISPGMMAFQHFSLGSAEAESELIMSWLLDLPSSTVCCLPKGKTPIAKSITSLRFAYFGRLSYGQAPAWYDHWVSLDHLPDLVRVSVWRAPDKAAPWLDFITRTNTTTSVDCVYTLESPLCRRME